MQIYVDHKLRIPESDLTEELYDLITDAMTIPNMERQQKMEQNISGWQDLPSRIQLWSCDKKGHLVLPRGFGFNLIYGLNAMGIEYEVHDLRTFSILPDKGKRIPLHSWQTLALAAILETQEGIWKAPAGSGKTVGILEAIRRIRTKSIVLVSKKDILWQWVERARSFLGPEYPVGQIGDRTFEISEYLTIAMVQTLHSRFDELADDGFFDAFGLMCLDECHHATAQTFNKIVNRFSCRYRLGVSATPDKTGDFLLATSVIGPVFYTTEPSDVTTLMKPEVLKVPTRFKFTYRPARGKIPSNYPKLIQALITNDERNRLIARTILLEEGHHCLVISKRLDHLERLESLIADDYEFPILRLTGSEGTEERQNAVKIASETPCVIFSTLADEALDIPRLDRGFLVFPQRNTGLITQQVGRFERICEGKTDAKIYDFCDLNIGPLENQWKVRHREVYNERGYKVSLYQL